MAWSIVAAERKLPLKPFDIWLFRKSAGHAFLAVKDDSGKTVLEIHGVALVAERKGLCKIRALSLTFAFVGNLLAGRPIGKGPLVHVDVLTQPETMQARAKGRVNYEHTLYEGPREGALYAVECFLRTAKTIEDGKIPYIFFDVKEGGRNCQSVLAEMADRAFRIALKPEQMVYAAPGITYDLERALPALSRIRPNIYASMSEIVGSIRKLLPQLDPEKTVSMSWLPELKPALPLRARVAAGARLQAPMSWA